MDVPSGRERGGGGGESSGALGGERGTGQQLAHRRAVTRRATIAPNDVRPAIPHHLR